MWIIVMFTEEDSVEVVPKKWILQGCKCYWPPYRGSKLKSAIADMQDVGSNWNLHPIRLIGNNKIYDNLLKARCDCDKAQFTSDYSENEGKRRIRKKTFSSSSEQDSDDSIKDMPKVPEVFPVNKVKEVRMKVVNLPESSCSSTEGSTQEQTRTVDVLNQDVSKSQPFVINKQEFEVQVLRKLTTLTLKMDQLGADLSNIQEMLILKKEMHTDVEFTYTLPIENIESFKNFENFLEVKENYEKFVIYLGKIGGCSEYELVKRVFARLLTDEVAVEFNWHGLKGKREFANTLIAKATIEAIMKNKMAKSEKTVELAIKSWLRHAKDRQRKPSSETIRQ